MPAPTPDRLRTAEKLTINVALEPAHHLLNSLVLLHWSEHYSGYAEWVTNTAVSLTPEQLHRNELVVLGLHYAVVPYRSWSSFEAYLNNLAAHNPITLRDRILDAYENLSCKEDDCELDREEMLSSPEAYLAALYERFDAEIINEELEREAYALMIDPPRMQQAIVNHLQEMWDTVLKQEWARIEPMLQASVDAFSQIDFRGLTPVEAARAVMGQDLPEYLEKSLEKTDDSLREIVFAPSAHVGPYLGKFKPDGVLWLLFGARLPEGTAVSSPDLSRSEMLILLNALADDTRLRILQEMRQEGELCSKDIMNRLDLSQSAASRHLKQLSATGYLTERRREGAKCYSLNPDRIETILEAMARFLVE